MQSDNYGKDIHASQSNCFHFTQGEKLRHYHTQRFRENPSKTKEKEKPTQFHTRAQRKPSTVQKHPRAKSRSPLWQEGIFCGTLGSRPVGRPAYFPAVSSRPQDCWCRPWLWRGISTVAGATREGPQWPAGRASLTRLSKGVLESINPGGKYCCLLLLLPTPPAGAGPTASQSTSTSAPTMPSVAHVSPASGRGAEGRGERGGAGALGKWSPKRPSQSGGLSDMGVPRLLIPRQADCQYRGLIGDKTQSRHKWNIRYFLQLQHPHCFSVCSVKDKAQKVYHNCSSVGFAFG